MDKKTRILKSVDEAVLRFIRAKGLLPKGCRILVGLSGGPDSVFLLHFFLRYRKMFALEVSAAHLNHSLRGKESDADENFCRGLCGTLGVPFHSKKTNVAALAKRKGISVEEAGREARYRFFSSLMKKLGYERAATAHTMNDNTESVLLNLIKGAGLAGLAGIAPIFNEKVIRPLLCLSKKDILRSLEVCGYEYRTDATNLDERYQRNFLRGSVIPPISKVLNPLFDDAVLRLSDNAAGASAFLDSYIASRFPVITGEKKKKRVEIPLQTLAEEHPFIQAEVLKRILQNVFLFAPSKIHIDGLLALLHAKPGKTIGITRQIQVTHGRDTLHFSAPNVEKIQEWPLRAGKGTIADGKLFTLEKLKYTGTVPRMKGCEFIDAEKVRGPLTLRYWKPGDRFTPLGMRGSKTISDFLADEKVSPALKKKQIVLCAGAAIVWVAGLRIGDAFKIGAQTKYLYKLCMK